MLRLLVCVCLIGLCIAQEDLHLKIAEKLAIPHYTRHAYDYPHIDFNRAQQGIRGQQPNQGGAFRQQGFSQPDPFNQPPPPVRQPISIRQQQPFSSQSSPNQPARQTRFFNLYTPNNRPEFRSQFGLDRRES